MGCPELPVEYYFRKSAYGDFPEDPGNCLYPDLRMVTVDPDGNLLSDGRFTYTWDGENRLVSLESGTGVSPVIRIKLDFTYDYMGRRVSKTVYNWDSNTNAYSLVPVASYKFVWDGWSLIAVFNASNQLVRSYTWGADGLLSDTDVTANKTYLAVYDGNLNIVAYVDASTGAKVAEYEYDAFGRIICKSGIKADDFNIMFASYQFDRKTGLTYLGFRYYNPETGRFLNRDPMQEKGGKNLYAMCRNNCVGRWDYLGGADFMNIGGIPSNSSYMNTGSSQSDIFSDLLNGAYDAGAAGLNYAAWGLVGDKFEPYHDGLSTFKINKYNFMIVYENGVLNTREDARGSRDYLMDKIQKGSGGFSQATVGLIHNPTGLLDSKYKWLETTNMILFGWIDIPQAGAHMLGMQDSTVRFLADKTNETLEKDGCAYVYWAAHSQGAGISSSAWRLVREDFKKRIRVMTAGPAEIMGFPGALSMDPNAEKGDNVAEFFSNTKPTQSVNNAVGSDWVINHMFVENYADKVAGMIKNYLKIDSKTSTTNP
ncbi:MAG TPA: hypothetical protein DET40_02335 [Lentisphaeria bacterium]|nr:MAG: hypothetical protein A2X45_16935 [Lentisphaerae bacterium GWF2_50_93]HCE42370.1 hypothetical protein [Lentisphaeria bacterium]